MDLIGQLSQQLGIEEGQAKALAGGLLGGLEAQVQEKVGAGEAEEMRAAIPELGDWKAQAANMLGGGGDAGGGDLMGALGGMLGGGGGGDGLGGLASAAAGMLGGGGAPGGSAGGLDVAFVTSLLGKLNLNPTVAATVAPMVASFLKDRLPAGLTDKLAMVAPFLGGSGGGAGGLGGMLGGLLGNK